MSLSHWSFEPSYLTRLRFRRKRRKVEQAESEEEDFVIVTKEELEMANHQEVTVATIKRSLSDDLSRELMEKARVEEEEEEAKFAPVKGDHLDFAFLTDEPSWRWISSHRVMLVMRGLSGSGKSTAVDAIRAAFPRCVVCSADDYFLGQDGVYRVRAGLEISPKCSVKANCVISLALSLKVHIFCDVVIAFPSMLFRPLHVYFFMIPLALPLIVHIFCDLVSVNRLKSERLSVTPLAFVNRR